MEKIIFIVILISAVSVFIDARRIGIKKNTLTGFWSSGYIAWSLGTLILWVIAFPIYLFKRADYAKALNIKVGNGFVIYGIVLILTVCISYYGLYVLSRAG